MSAHGVNILSIEDDRIQKILLSKKLEEYGVAKSLIAVETMSAAEALSNTEDIELAIVDLHLQDTKDPEDTLRRFKAHFPNTPYVILTASPEACPTWAHTDEKCHAVINKFNWMAILRSISAEVDMETLDKAPEDLRKVIRLLATTIQDLRAT